MSQACHLCVFLSIPESPIFLLFAFWMTCSNKNDPILANGHIWLGEYSTNLYIFYIFGQYIGVTSILCRKTWPPMATNRWFHQIHRDRSPILRIFLCRGAADAAVFVVQSLLPFAGSAMSLHSQLFGRQEFKNEAVEWMLYLYHFFKNGPWQ